MPSIVIHFAQSRLFAPGISFLLVMAVVVLALTTGKNGPNYFSETTKTTQKWNNNEDSWDRLDMTKSSSRNHLLKITETLVNDWNQSESQALPNVTNASINFPPTEAMRQDLKHVTRENSTRDTNSSLKNTTVTTINNNRSKHKYNAFLHFVSLVSKLACGMFGTSFIETSSSLTTSTLVFIWRFNHENVNVWETKRKDCHQATQHMSWMSCFNSRTMSQQCSIRVVNTQQLDLAPAK
jgi:hypothetical protein